MAYARLMLWLSLALLARPLAVLMATEPLSGEQIYRQSCAHCHGDKGEGVKDEYAEPLIGDRSINELTRLISKTMPKDDPGSCSATDAQAVATYIYDAFYSPTAQVRNKPPRIELSRLTVRQYRNAVTDLVGSFRNEPKWENQQGLQGEYYKSRRFRREDRFIERVDREVRFDFGESSPDPKLYDGHDFSMRWEGSLVAPTTGQYDIVIRTEHATRLWLNDNNRPLIDAWVKSGNDMEYRESIFLLAGRVYPLKLEFSKAKQGVDDKKMAKPSKASIALLWQLPNRPVEVIPARFLTPQRYPESFVVTTAFPPDDRSVGYERGTSISKEWDNATTDCALETAAFVAKKLNELAGTNDKDNEREKKLKTFCERFVERAFRRPLTDEQLGLYINRQFEGAKDHETAVKRVVLLALKSPRFLYQTAPTQAKDDFIVAERIALGMWDSLPDQQLRDAAAQGKLKTADDVRKQAERMATDLRARTKLKHFFEQWLRLDHMTEISKDPSGFPEFNADVVADLRTSLDMFVNDVLTSDSADFRQLLLSDSMYLNGRLAKLYGADLPADAPFQKVALEPGERAGVLSHPLLMSGFAYTSTSSPIHRGVFVSRSILGRALKQPPEAVAPLAPDLHADLSTRDRIALQTKAEMCMGCHAMINPLGFAFERFDAVGRLRQEEKGRPVDATGHYETRSGETKTFAGVRPLAEFLAASEETHAALVAQLFHNTIRQPIAAYGPEQLPQLRQQFADNQFNLRRLMIEIVVSAALKDVPPAEGT